MRSFTDSGGGGGGYGGGGSGGYGGPSPTVFVGTLLILFFQQGKVAAVCLNVRMAPFC